MAAETARALLHDILGPIRPILAREDVTDLCINGPGLLFVECCPRLGAHPGGQHHRDLAQRASPRRSQAGCPRPSVSARRS